MKKTVLSLVLAACLLLATACGNQKPAVNPTGGQSTTTTSTAPTKPDGEATDSTTNGGEVSTTARPEGTAATTATTTRKTATTNPTRRPDRTNAVYTVDPVGVAREPVNRDDVAPLSQTVTWNGATYNLVWNDEFTQQGIDYDKWCYGLENGDNRADLILLTEQEDPSVITADDGLLKMNARRYYSKTDSQVQYATNKAFSTRETMNFRYGFVEMRAVVPIRQGAFSSLWSVGANKAGTPFDSLIRPQRSSARNYYVEVDFFEEFGSTDTIYPNYHKWYDDPLGAGNGLHTSFDVNHVLNVMKLDKSNLGKTQLNGHVFYSTADLPYEFHLYQIEWTPEYIKTYVDGKLYGTMDLTFNYDKNWTLENQKDPARTLTADIHAFMEENDSTGMDGFRDYIYLLLQNQIYGEQDEAVGEVGSVSADHVIDENTVFPYQFWVDYIRVYQNPALNPTNGQDSLYTNGLLYKKNGQLVNYYAQ